MKQGNRLATNSFHEDLERYALIDENNYKHTMYDIEEINDEATVELPNDSFKHERDSEGNVTKVTVS